MKLFLSSTTKDLIDARNTFIKQFEEICHNKIELISWEKNSGSSILSPEDTCFDLVNKCNAVMLVLDRFYGNSNKRYGNISITHAEVRRALEMGLHIIPIIRDPTWYEFKVWRKNKGTSIKFDHVEEPKLFEIIEELFYRFNCQHYEEFTSIYTMNKIAKNILGMLQDGDFGALDHMVLV